MSTSLAQNDLEYEAHVCGDHNSLPFLTASLYHLAEVYGKPLFGAPASTLLEYPRHQEFNNRISQSQFTTIQEDLKQELYNRSNWFGVFRPISTFFGSYGTDRIRAIQIGTLHAVISYYNRYLFHPMLIDAQVFVSSRGSRRYYVGFLVARDSTQYLTFKRPVLGKSRGYLNPCATENIDFKLEIGYSIPMNVPSSPPTPPSMHAPGAGLENPMQIGSQYVAVPVTEESMAEQESCPPLLLAAANAAPSQSTTQSIVYATVQTSPITPTTQTQSQSHISPTVASPPEASNSIFSANTSPATPDPVVVPASAIVVPFADNGNMEGQEQESTQQRPAVVAEARVIS